MATLHMTLLSSYTLFSCHIMHMQYAQCTHTLTCKIFRIYSCIIALEIIFDVKQSIGFQRIKDHITSTSYP